MPRNRRSFLGTLFVAAGAVVIGAADRAAPRRRITAPGVQLYTLRGELQRDLPGTLARVAEIGYRQVEFAGYFNRAPAEIRDLLERYELNAPSTHVSLGELSRSDAVLRAAAEIGHAFVTVPSLPQSDRASLEALRRTAATFNRLANDARTAGLRFAFHNHDVEFAPVEGTEPLTVLLQETDPALVSFQLDVYWAFRAGKDPLALLNAHPQRFTMLHLKDSAGPPEHRMVDVGAGVIDWRAILRRSTAGVQHAFVEHDRPADAFASVRASYTYLQGMGT